VLGVIERTGHGRSVEVLTDPGFAIEVLVGEPGVDPGVVGRVLDFLRARHGCTTIGPATPAQALAVSSAVRLADAIAGYEAGPLALMAKGTGHTYRTWTRRLAIAYGEQTPRDVTAGDLKDVIARHVLAARSDGERRRSGRSAEENAVSAYRSLWAYFVEKGWADTNVASTLTKPSRAEPNRRPLRPDEVVLLRHLAVGTGHDPLLDEVALSLAERLGLRRVELCRLRFCDLDLGRGEVGVWARATSPAPCPSRPASLGCSARMSRTADLHTWVGPNGLDTRIDVWDARDGGEWKYTAIAGGEEHRLRVCLHQIAHTQIVQTFTWEGMPDSVSLDTLRFEDLGDGTTRLHSQSLVDSFEGRDAWLSSDMEVGVHEGYAKLDAIIDDTTSSGQGGAMRELMIDFITGAPGSSASAPTTSLPVTTSR
jgi:integrase